MIKKPKSPFILVAIATFLFSNFSFGQTVLDANLESMFTSYKVTTIQAESLMTQARSGDFFTAEIPRQDGGSYTVELHESSIISDQYVSKYVDDNGEHVSQYELAVPTKGHIVGDLSSSVSLTFNDGFIYGYIKDSEGEHFIEPASYYSSIAKANTFVLYDATDVRETAPKMCGTTEMHVRGQQAKGQDDQGAARSMVDECFEVEWAIANDFLMYQQYNSIPGVENHAIGVANNVQTNYDDEFADEIQFVLTAQFTATTAASDPWTSNTNAGTLLNDFTSWGPGGFGVTHDVGSLWTNRNFDGSTIGIAWVGVVCTNSRYNCLQDFTNNANTKRVMVAHELGHNFSSFHDAGGSGFIMAPSVNTSTTWSSTSIADIESHISSRWCLDNCTSSTNPPVADFTANVIEDCTVGEVVYISNSTGTDLAYSWEFPGGVPATSTQESPSVQYPDAGTFSASLTVTNSAGTNTLSDPSAATIVNSPEVEFAFNVNESLVSFFNVSQYSDAYLWDFGDGNTSTQSDPLHTYEEDGSYNVTLSGFNFCGEQSVTYEVIIATAPSADFTTDIESGCAPLTVQYTSQASSNTEGYAWVFEGGMPETSTAANPQVVYESGGTYDVTMTVSNSIGSDMVQITNLIDVQGTPDAEFSYTVDGSTITIDNESLWGEDFIWTFGDGESSTEVEPTHTYEGDGDYLVTLTVESPCGSNSISQTISISLAPNPSFAITGSAEGCAPLTIAYENTSTNSPDAYEWTFEGGTPASSTEANPSVSYNTAGVYDVTLTVSNENGANTEVFADYVIISSGPDADFDVAEDGLAVTFTDASQDADTYEWTFGDGASSTEASPSHTYTQEGVYEVTLVVTNECGMSSEVFTINNYTPVSAAIGSDITSGCADLEVTFDDQSSVNVESWLWTFQGGIPATSTEQNPTVAYAVAGQYDVTLTVSHPESSETIQLVNYVSVSDMPQTSFEYFDDQFDVSFTNTTVEGSSYSWDFGDGNASTEENPMHTYSAEGTYEVILTATNSCGTTTTTASVIVNALPTAGFGVAESTGCGPFEVAFSNESSSNVTGWSWSFEGGNPATSDEESPVVTFTQSGTYDVTLEVTSAAGTNELILEDYITVLAEPTAEIAQSVDGNVFSAESIGSNAASSTWSIDGQTFSGATLDYVLPSNGTYIVDLTTSNQCGSTTVSTEVIISAYPEISTGDLTRIVCVGDEVEFAEMSDNVDAWMWTFEGADEATSAAASPVVTYSNAGTYDVNLLITNEYGEAQESFVDVVTVITVPSVEIAGVQSDNVIDLEAIVSGATTIEWDFGDGNRSMDTNTSHTYTSNGTYTVTLTASNQCGETTSTLEYIVNTLTVTEGDLERMRIYPIPTNNYLNIELDNRDGEEITATMLDVSGRQIMSSIFRNNKHSLDVSALPNGTYMIKLQGESATHYRKVLIVR